jgi:hypothetical protein
MSARRKLRRSVGHDDQSGWRCGGSEAAMALIPPEVRDELVRDMIQHAKCAGIDQRGRGCVAFDVGAASFGCLVDYRKQSVWFVLEREVVPVAQALEAGREPVAPPVWKGERSDT